MASLKGALFKIHMKRSMEKQQMSTLTCVEKSEFMGKKNVHFNLCVEKSEFMGGKKGTKRTSQTSIRLKCVKKFNRLTKR